MQGTHGRAEFDAPKKRIRNKMHEEMRNSDHMKYLDPKAPEKNRISSKASKKIRKVCCLTCSP